MSGDMFTCCNWGWKRGDTAGVYWIETKDTAKYPTVYRTVSYCIIPNKELSGLKCQEF